MTIKSVLTDWRFWFSIGVVFGVLSVRDFLPNGETLLSDHRLWLLAALLTGFLVFARQRPSLHAGLGFAAYFVDVLLFNLWTFVFYPENFESWEQAVDVWARQWEVWSFSLNSSGVVALSFLVAFMFWPVHKSDLLAKMIWSTFLIHAWWSVVFENYVCNIYFSRSGSSVIKSMLGEGESIYACGRIFGENIVWVPTAIVFLWLLWLVWVHQRARARLS